MSRREYSTAKRPRFSIIIPTYNRAAMLDALLRSLETMVVPESMGWEVLIVDNNSIDNTADVVEACARRGRIIVRRVVETQQGASFARNRGVQESRGEIIGFLDDDETVSTEWLAMFQSAFARGDCSGVGGRVIPQWKSTPPDWYATEGPYRIFGATVGHDLGDELIEYSASTLLPGTGNMAVTRECFERFGLFRTDMGPVGDKYQLGEDTEFCMRLIGAGERLVYVPSAIVFNAVHPERVTKRYCKQYHFRCGRVLARLYQAELGTRMIGSMPRHLFRAYAETLVFWLGNVVRGRRKTGFYYRLMLARIGGQIYYHSFEKDAGSQGATVSESTEIPFTKRKGTHL